MKKPLALLLMSSAFALNAQERNGPEGRHEVNSWTTPSFSGSDFMGGANLSSLKSSLGYSSEILQQDKFDSSLEVNTNRGSLKVDFSLPLPANLIGKKSLTFEYNHRQKQNFGFGVGINLLLPKIEKSLDGSIRFNSAKYVKTKCLSEATLCYKASLENDFSFIYETVDKNYIFSSRNEKQMLFNSNGQIISEYDNYKNEIQYQWDGAKLLKIIDVKQGWEVLFNYTGTQAIPVFVGDSLVKLPKKLDSISFKKGNETKKAILAYQDEYLSLVKWENGKKDIFRASYEAIAPDFEEISISKLNDEEVYITQEDPNKVVASNTKESENISLYIDLNNDYRLDKFEFNAKAYRDKIESYLKGLDYDVRGDSISNCKAIPKKTIEQVNSDLSQIEMSLDFYWAKVTEGKSFEYIRDNRLSGMKLKPGVFKLEEKKTKNDNCHNVFYYSVEKMTFKKPTLMSQNTDDEKAIVWISPSIETKGNLAKRLFETLESNTMIPSQRVQTEIWSVVTDREKLSNLYPKFGTIKENVVPEVRSFVKHSSLSIASDAIIFDYNQDGFDDIFEGDRVLLQNSIGIFEDLFLTVDNLKNDFELEHGKHGEKFFLINNGGKIKITQGGNSFSLRDYDIVDSTKITPGSAKKLLKTYETPFGGKFEVQFINQNKTQLVSKIIKKDDVKVHHEREFTYTDSMFDFYTGTFIGFEKTFEKIKSSATQDQKIIERNFLADAYPSVVLFEQRARLQGRIFSEIHSTTVNGRFLKKTWSWDGVELDNNRIYPYMTETALERLNGQDKTIEILRTQNEIMEWSGFDFIKTNKTTTFSFNDLVPIHKGGELREVTTHYNLNAAGHLNLDSKEMKFGDRVQTKSYVYNEEGRLTQESSNKKIQTYNYDDVGRLIKSTDFRGLVTELYYHGLNVAPFSIISGDEKVEITRGGVFSLPLIQEIHDKKYLFSHNIDLENVAIDLVKKDKKTRIFQKDEFQQNGNYLVPYYRLSIQDKKFDIRLDQFGEPLKAIEEFQGKKRIVFENEIVDDLILKSSSSYFENDLILSSTTYSYNGKGEKLSSKYQSIEGTLNYVNKYVDGCESTELNGKKISSSCKNLLNQIVMSSFLDEYSRFGWTEEGNLSSVNDTHSWRLNSDSEITDFSFERDDFSQEVSIDSKKVTSGNKTKIFDEKGREIELYLDSNKVFQAYKYGFLSNLKMTQSSQIIHEEKYSYDHGNLVNIKSKKFQKNFEYDEFERVAREVTTTSKGRHQLDYKYSNGEIVSIRPFVKNISYDANLRIKSVHYENGLVANLTYYKDTEVLKAIQYSNQNKLVYAHNSSFNNLAQLLTHQVMAPSWGREANSTHSYKDFVLQNAPVKKSYLEKSGDLSHCGEYVCRDREFELFYTSSLGLKLGRSVESGEEFLFINSHEVIVEDKFVKLVELNGTPLGVLINNEFYPTVIGNKKEIIGLINSSGEKLLFLRSFDLYGNKKLIASEDKVKAEELDNLTVWSFGRLRHNPLEIGYSKNLYFSLSRAYSTQTGQWTSVDPLVAWGPQALVSNPGNWNPYSYCNGDPVNCVDPSGYYGVKENLERRREINTNFSRSVIRTSTGIVFASQFNRIVSKMGGVTLKELVRSKLNVPTLGVLGTISNFSVAALGRIALTGMVFGLSFELGNIGGAVLDTIVDNDVNSWPAIWGFGSGVLNSEREDLFTPKDIFDSYFSEGKNTGKSFGDIDGDNYPMGDYNF